MAKQIVKFKNLQIGDQFRRLVSHDTQRYTRVWIDNRPHNALGDDGRLDYISWNEDIEKLPYLYWWEVEP